MSHVPMYPAYSIILVDDEKLTLVAASYVLKKSGFTNVETIQDSRLVLERLAAGGCGIVLLDVEMPHVNGKEILRRISIEYPEISVLMVTGTNDVSSVVECMKLGAADYIVKPFHYDKLIELVRQTINAKSMQSEHAALKSGILDSSLKHPGAFTPIITHNKAMRSLFKYIEVIADTELPILIAGETGTGKELTAQAIHTVSGRPGKFVTVNVAGIDDNILNDTLFGHVRGAFTGADRNRNGLIEEAANGTIFLDEIGDLKLESQTKLLRLIQERTYHPVGADTPLVSTARIVTATNCDLKSMIRSGEFRYDLFYRLQSHEIRLPALRNRMDDLPWLAEAFVDEACEIFKKPRPYLGPELMTLLTTYHWPGNVRELRGLLIDAISRNTSRSLNLTYLKEKLRELRSSHLMDATDAEYSATAAPADGGASDFHFPLTLPTLDEWDTMLINEAMQRTHGNKSQAAELLGIARTTLIKRLKESSGADVLSTLISKED